MTSATRRRCFISAPADAPVGDLVAALGRHGWEAYVLTDVVRLGEPVVSATVEAIKACDAMIAVLAGGGSRDNVAFEAGIAVGLNKQVLLVIPPTANRPTDLLGIASIRAEPDDVEAIEFALGLLERERQPSAQSARGKPIGLTASAQLASKLTPEISNAQASRLLTQALQAGGAIVVSAGLRDQGYDLGVWSDDLATIGATPLLIELKRRVDERAALQLLDGLRLSSTARVGLLVHLEPGGPKPGAIAPSILSIGLADLLTRLSDESFAEIVRDLRNQAAHGRS